MNKETNKENNIKLTDGEVILLLELEKLCNVKVDGGDGTGWAIASKEYLQKKLGMSRATIYRSLRRLSEANLIVRKEIPYKDRMASAISVNKEVVKERLDAAREKDDILKDGFLKVPYAYLEAFKV